MTKVLPAAPSTSEAHPAIDGPQDPGRRFLRGRFADPTRERRALLVLLTGTGLLYLWGLGSSGWANAFYSAAAQADGQSWKAWFYGSFDTVGSITVDKPPGALWVDGLSVRLFGLSSWSILVPQALMGIATVWLVHLTVRRVAGVRAGLLAGALTALTPVAVLVFRFDNPDALLVLLLTGAAYAVTRALEHARGRWLLLAGALIGLAFLTKMLQAFLVLPGFTLAYLIAAPTTLGRRIGHLLASGAAMVVAGGWWIAVVELVPPSSRPWIGGSQTNSVWELLWGYNGLGRLNGDETGSVTSQPARHFGNIGRLFGGTFAGDVSWLLPAALILLIGALVLLRGVPRTDPTRAALMIWGGWLVVTGLTFSLAAGIIHPYYTVALAPAIGAVVAVAGRPLWQQRARTWVRRLLAVALVATTAWSWVLLHRVGWYQPWLRWVVVVAGVVAVVVLLRPTWARGRVAVAATAAAAVAALAGPVAFAWTTASWPHHGALPTAGPQRSPVIMGSTTIVTTPGKGTTSQGTTANGTGVTVTGAPPEQSGLGPLVTPRATGPGGLFPGLPVASWGAMGNLLIDPDHVTPAVRKLLDDNASSYTWAGATLGSENAAGFQLASGHPVLPLGGFNASDPFPTLAQFRADVAAHRIHWFIGGGVTEPSSSGSDEAHRIAAWVVAHYPEQVVDGVILYDLSGPPA